MFLQQVLKFLALFSPFLDNSIKKKEEDQREKNEHSPANFKILKKQSSY